MTHAGAPLQWKHTDVNPERLRQAPNVAIVGSSSPLGKELREIIETSAFPVGKLSLLETEEYAGLLQEFAGEIRITQIISPEVVHGHRYRFLRLQPGNHPGICRKRIGVSRTDDRPDANRPDGNSVSQGRVGPSLLQGAGYYVNPHPAAIALGRVLARIQSAFQRGVGFGNDLCPASERGSAGVNELQEQTVELLNFQSVESKVFRRAAGVQSSAGNRNIAPNGSTGSPAIQRPPRAGAASRGNGGDTGSRVSFARVFGFPETESNPRLPARSPHA